VIILGMLLFCERTWKHHCVTLLLPFAVITYRLIAFRCGKAMRAYLIGTLAAVTLLMAMTSTSLLDSTAKLMQVYGAYVWAYLLLLTALVVVLRRPEMRLTTTDATSHHHIPARLAHVRGQQQIAVAPLRQEIVHHQQMT
jgi:hypothetical protein